MSTAQQLLVDLARHGIRLRVVGERLQYAPREQMTPQFRERLHRCRDEVLKLLADPASENPQEPPPAVLAAALVEVVRRLQAEGHVIGTLRLVIGDAAAAPAAGPELPPPEDLAADLRELWEERAAILEHEAGLSRREAEHAAQAELIFHGQPLDPQAFVPWPEPASDLRDPMPSDAAPESITKRNRRGTRCP